MTTSAPPEFGSKNLRLPDDLRGPLLQHLTDLKCHYQNLDWAGECGWGERPAIVVIDVAIWWTDPNCFPMGSNVDPIVEATAQVLEAGRAAGIPIIFLRPTITTPPSRPRRTRASAGRKSRPTICSTWKSTPASAAR